MMKNRQTMNFWFGFLVSSIAVAWLYWLWRRNREVLPGPVVLGKRPLEPNVVQKTETVVEPPPAVTVDTSKTKKTKQQAEKENLEVIDGIGPATARRFNDAGVYTFAQLGALSLEKIQQIAGASRWDPAKWKKEARRLSRNL